MQRRVVAAAQHHGIPLSDLEGLYLSSGYGRDFALISDTGRGISVNHRLVERIITRAKELGIVRIVLDPHGSQSAGPESIHGSDHYGGSNIGPTIKP